jgi:hypothetical protein
MAAELIQAVGERGRYCFAAWKNVAFIIWLAPADGDAIAAMSRFSDGVIRSWPSISSIHIIEAGAGMPTKTGRDTLTARAQSNKKHLACVAALMPEPSLTSTLLCAFVRGIRVLTRGGLDICIEQQVSPLASWLAPRHTERTGVSLSAPQLGQLIAGARRRGQEFVA